MEVFNHPESKEVSRVLSPSIYFHSLAIIARITVPHIIQYFVCCPVDTLYSKHSLSAGSRYFNNLAGDVEREECHSHNLRFLQIFVLTKSIYLATGFMYHATETENRF
jgi:hypothetical protein